MGRDDRTSWPNSGNEWPRSRSLFRLPLPLPELESIADSLSSLVRGCCTPLRSNRGNECARTRSTDDLPFAIGRESDVAAEIEVCFLRGGTSFSRTSKSSAVPPGVAESVGKL